MRFIRSQIGLILKETGLCLDQYGSKLGYNHQADLFLTNHKTLFPIGDASCILSKTCKVANQAHLAGQVELSDNVIVGHQSVLLAKDLPIRVGPNSIIGDGVTIHSRLLKGQVLGSVNIGANVTIGDKCTLISCLIDDGAWIGHSSIVEEGAVIQRGAIVGPGSFVPAGYILEADCVYQGSPVIKTSEAGPKDKEMVARRYLNTAKYYNELEPSAFLPLK